MALVWTIALLLAIPLGLDLYLPAPADNPLTAENVALGRRLFHERRLSRDESISCASCHDPARAFSDGRAVPVGVSGRRGRRSAPALLNRAYGRAFFWDARITTLEEQVLRPIEEPSEMDLPLDEAAGRVGLPVRAISHALASYVRTILSGDAPYDRYVNGDTGALTSEQLRGMQTFRGKGHCATCHSGPTLSDERLHNTGVAWVNGRFLDDGRFTVTSNEADRGAFKTPTLRDLRLTAPYMHDGSMPTLEAVVDFYDEGGRANPNRDRELQPLGLTQVEKRELISFLGALSGRIRDGF